MREAEVSFPGVRIHFCSKWRVSNVHSPCMRKWPILHLLDTVNVRHAMCLWCVSPPQPLHNSCRGKQLFLNLFPGAVECFSDMELQNHWGLQVTAYDWHCSLSNWDILWHTCIGCVSLHAYSGSQPVGMAIATSSTIGWIATHFPAEDKTS